MSQTVVLDNGQQLIINTDTTKIFIWDNRFDSAGMNNSGYTTVVYPAGTVLGRVLATGRVTPYTSANQLRIVGVLNEDQVIPAGTTKTVFYCVSGDVAPEGIVLQGSDTLDTIVNGQLIRDRIAGETVGIKLTPGAELTKFDNS